MASANMLEDDPFLLQMESVRDEIVSKFRITHQVLMETEAALLSELQQIEARYRAEGEQMREIAASREQIVRKLRENPTRLKESVAPLDARKRELEISLETVKERLGSVVLEWNGDLERVLSETGVIRVRGSVDYKKKGKPVMVACKHRKVPDKADRVFCCPQSVTIDPQTKNIYVSDDANNRVQVFTQSLQFLFKFSDMMNSPGGICISQSYVFVAQHKDNCLNVYSTGGEFLQSVGRKGVNELEFDSPSGIAVSVDYNRIYVCELKTLRIHCLNSDLTFHSFISDVMIPKDVKCTSNEIIVLYISNPCISFYNYSHQLLKEIIPCGEGTQVLLPFNFCLDYQGNILITDYSAHCVVIFSNRGEFIHKFGQKGEGRGEFISPTAIALDSENRIIVASENPEHCIQLF